MGMGMNYIYDNHGDRVMLYDLAYFVYQGFGASGVVRFIASMEKDLPDVVWTDCEPCENDYFPHQIIANATVCLVCGHDKTYTDPIPHGESAQD